MYGPLPNYGLQPRYRDSRSLRGEESDTRYFSRASGIDSPIFFTSINYPGVYGSQTIGIVARTTRTWPRTNYFPPASGVGFRDYGPLDTARVRVPLEPSPSTATLRVHVPTVDAEVYLNGERTRLTGTTRDFTTSVLLAGREYTYDVRVEWQSRDGRKFTDERRVTVQAGDNAELEMAPPAREGSQESSSSTLRTLPNSRLPRR
jgi:uncharacterized protein (TIGR03000 family)